MDENQNSNKKIIWIVGILILAVLVGVLFYFFSRKAMPPAPAVPSRAVIQISPQPKTIFIKTGSWDPCPKGVPCYETITLYPDGKLVREGRVSSTITLDQKTVAAIEDAMKSSQIFEKACPRTISNNYHANYTLTLKGDTKLVTYPGCEKELSVIEALLPQ